VKAGSAAPAIDNEHAAIATARLALKCIGILAMKESFNSATLWRQGNAATWLSKKYLSKWNFSGSLVL
jgi:hypothetical protein